MATQKLIRKRIAGVQSTGKITRAMKMIAAIKLRRVQQALHAARIYYEEVRRILDEVISMSKEVTHPLLNGHERRVKKVDLIVISSERGLCGAFNENLLKKCEAHIAGLKEQGHEVFIYVLGRKGRDHLKARGYGISREIVGVAERDLAPYLEKSEIFFGGRHASHESDETLVAFNEFKSAGAFTPVIKKLLPVASKTGACRPGIDYLYEPSRDDITDYLAKEAVTSKLFLAYHESVAAETSARMVAMEKASKNADDIIRTLTLQMNKARQASITTELIDIVGGAAGVA